MSFRGINTTVIQIRRQVFTEVARMAYANVKGEQANHLMRKIPYTIIPGEEGKLPTASAVVADVVDALKHGSKVHDSLLPRI